MQPGLPGIRSQPGGFSTPGNPVRGYAKTTTSPARDDKSTVVPSVAGSGIEGTFRPDRWPAAPSSGGAGIVDQSGASTWLLMVDSALWAVDTVLG